TVGNGRSSEFEWQGWIPFRQNPHVINPERGFVSSANQYLTDESYPYYLGESFAPFERGRRINDLLRDGNDFTIKDMQRMQLDNHSYRAEKILPVMLDELNFAELSQNELFILQNLIEWDYTNRGESTAPTLFNEWWGALYNSVWEDVFDASFPLRRPSGELTMQMLLNDPDSKWINNTKSDIIESLSDLVISSYKESIENLEERFGAYGEGWQWGYYNNTDLAHLGRIPGLGEMKLFTDGARESLNAIRGSHGPSWRMVVELGPEVKGYGVYPGGQSGNPGSGSYTEFISTWHNGGLFELQFFREKPDPDDFPLVIRFR
ncbi:MAG: penicillin acylase family protein, partial [Balneolaceae bacterium]